MKKPKPPPKPPKPHHEYAAGDFVFFRDGPLRLVGTVVDAGEVLTVQAVYPTRYYSGTCGSREVLPTVVRYRLPREFAARLVIAPGQDCATTTDGYPLPRSPLSSARLSR